MQLQTDNVFEIELFGLKLLLSERTARDVNNFDKYVKDNGFEYQDAIIQRIITIRDGLRINFKILKWWQFFRRSKLKKITAEIYLLSNLSTRKIVELSNKVLELEGIEVKKKVLKDHHTELAVTLQPD